MNGDFVERQCMPLYLSNNFTFIFIGIRESFNCQRCLARESFKAGLAILNP